MCLVLPCPSGETHEPLVTRTIAGTSAQPATSQTPEDWSLLLGMVVSMSVLVIGSCGNLLTVSTLAHQFHMPRRFRSDTRPTPVLYCVLFTWVLPNSFYVSFIYNDFMWLIITLVLRILFSVGFTNVLIILGELSCCWSCLSFVYTSLMPVFMFSSL